jgi:hypothetical protein
MITPMMTGASRVGKRVIKSLDEINGKMSKKINRKIFKKTLRGGFTDQFSHPEIT